VIITRSPLRISLGGGGTDLASYYRENGGFVISAAINRYVYITLHKTFVDCLIVKYSEMERVETVDQLRHPLIREALKLTDVGAGGLEISSMSDIPEGTGLGSSGSFTTALLYSLHMLKRKSISKRSLAEMACHIEIDILGEPIGKQDQYIGAFGGITCFEFRTDGTVGVEPVRISPETLANIEDNLSLFFTGFSRSASNILRDQDTRSKQRDHEMIENLHFIKRLGYESKAALESGDLHAFAEILDVHWEHKRKRSPGMSNGRIDAYYELARNNGALGGKLVGAGGGGFLMLYTEDKTRLRRAMYEAGLREVRFQFDFEGARLVVDS
jgi:D-glycero-alpha-D-manno-heptose-7-phosphate kinase